MNIYQVLEREDVVSLNFRAVGISREVGPGSGPHLPCQTIYFYPAQGEPIAPLVPSSHQDSHCT